MATAHPVIQAPFLADQILQGSRLGLMQFGVAVDARMAFRAVVVDQQQGLAEPFLNLIGQLQQGVMLQRLVEALHQQLRAVAIDGQARCAFLRAMEQAIAVGVLRVQLAKQVFTVVEGGAQRLIKSGHARHLGVGKSGSLSRKALSLIHI